MLFTEYLVVGLLGRSGVMSAAGNESQDCWECPWQCLFDGFWTRVRFASIRKFNENGRTVVKLDGPRSAAIGDTGKVEFVLQVP